MPKFHKIKISLFSFFYKHIGKPIFFLLDPEFVHDAVTLFGKMLGSNPVTRAYVKFLYHISHPSLEQIIHGITFKNPIGLAAGFDKNAVLTNIIPEVGFGFMEVGSVTGFPCEGNKKPRLWRLKRSQGLVVNYGLKNDGAMVVSVRLHNNACTGVLGVSIAMTNVPENNDIETAIFDYKKAFLAVKDRGDYLTVNISCPNTCGGQPFKDFKNLEKLLRELQLTNFNKPVFFKMSPDMTREEIDGIITLAHTHHVTGFICTNLTKNRENPALVDEHIPTVGGISGKPVQVLSDSMIEYIYKKTKREFVIIGCGGVFSAEDAYRKIRKGASLIQLITGMIFEGPQLVGAINSDLVELLKRYGFSSISEAVWVYVPYI